MQRIPVEGFLVFVRTLEGEELPTRAGRSSFTVRVTGDDLEFTPVSTGKARLHRRSYVERVLDQFQGTGSWANTDYKFTVNATYQLTLMDRYLRAQKAR